MDGFRLNLVLRYCFPLRTWEREIDAKIGGEMAAVARARRRADCGSFEERSVDADGGYDPCEEVYDVVG